jgi:hypothetical protein
MSKVHMSGATVWDSISSYEAQRNLNTCPAAKWKSTVERYGQRFFVPVLGAPKFKIGGDEAFFMIGSCFARGLEAALSARGMAVLSKSGVFAQWTPTAPGTTAMGATNKYNLGTVLNEIKWSMGEATYPQAAILSTVEGYYDPHLTPVFAAAAFETVLAQRYAMTSLMREVRAADIVVLTLGLVEVWYDTKTELYLNSTPAVPSLKNEPDRFKFCRLGYEDNIMLLRNVYEILRTHGKKGHRLVLTVSPIPLASTFTKRDVVEATTYSKSVLRVVAEDFVRHTENAEYFPSYEIVMNSPRQYAWMEDGRHVRGELANCIMKQFVDHYMPTVGPAVTVGTDFLG